MDILYVGADSGTSGHRFHAFGRLGHRVRLIDPRRLLPPSSLIDRIEWKIHPGLLTGWVSRKFLDELGEQRFDAAFVDSGSLVGPELLQRLKKQCGRVINYNVDDPFGQRDRARFLAYRQAVPHYDLVVVVRSQNVAEARALGARRVLYAVRVADEVAHAPRLITAEIERQWSSKVAFVGTWMPERGPFFRELIERGVPLTIFGDGWEKAPEWPVLQPVRRTSSLEGDEYCYAIQCAKINIGMISIGNRDLHTQRSLEIPALGSVLCAKRTSEHEQLYVDGKEALFWNDAEECARICMGLLDDEIRRKRLALAGQERARSNGHFSEPLLTRILQEAFA